MTEPKRLPERTRQLLEDLWRQGIRDQRVLRAIAFVPRERFVPESQQEHAWDNVALPIGSGQTISQPYIVGLMSQALKLKGHERVLEIGTGSGYHAAVLSLLAERVVSIERHASLADSAESLLTALGLDNVEVHQGAGTLGWPEDAPYEGILITAGAPRVPASLHEQLHPDGGRLVIPIGTLEDQRLFVYERRGDRLSEHDLGPVRFVPLVGDGAWSPDDETGFQL
jgi:protein-L-isoaspartate(D-aspartate) O-methyltransferase